MSSTRIQINVNRKNEADIIDFWRKNPKRDRHAILVHALRVFMRSDGYYDRMNQKCQVQISTRTDATPGPEKEKTSLNSDLTPEQVALIDEAMEALANTFP